MTRAGVSSSELRLQTERIPLVQRLQSSCSVIHFKTDGHRSTIAARAVAALHSFSPGAAAEFRPEAERRLQRRRERNAASRGASQSFYHV
ncbi:hypothetical protein EYF80_034971 [Liparis tanakae]|uniref:Uncharacterized protein n=1 Tax=Liparis tanakae TaxID=230148 RepID=A0A4Z2GQ66_9TELE|nr:hypothetical protein EYF80_034971 [Liparis tanakae]